MATISGATSGVSVIPQSSSANTITAQLLLNGMATINGGAQVSGNTLTPSSQITTTGTVVVGVGGNTPTALGPVNITVSPNVVGLLINNLSRTTAANTVFHGNQTVVAGSGGLTFTDNGFFTTINVGGGTNAVTLAGTGANFSGDGTNSVLISGLDRGSADTITGTSTGSLITVQHVVGSTKNLLYVDRGGMALINPTAGNVTVVGSVGLGTQTVFGGSADFGRGVVTANAFTGSLTVTGGQGYFAGGTAGKNFLQAGTAGSTTLVGGGNNDTLTAGGAGDILVAANKGTTTISGGAFGNASMFASDGGNTLMFGSKAQGDTFFLSNSTVSGTGYKGSFIAAHTGPNASFMNLNTNVSNTFAISGGAEFGSVYDFISGIDKVAVSSAQGSATLYVPSSGSGQFVLATSTGTTIAFFTKIQASDIQGVNVTVKLF